MTLLLECGCGCLRMCKIATVFEAETGKTQQGRLARAHWQMATMVRLVSCGWTHRWRDWNEACSPLDDS